MTYGLSYTQFAIDVKEFCAQEGKVNCTVEVTSFSSPFSSTALNLSNVSFTAHILFNLSNTIFSFSFNLPADISARKVVQMYVSCPQGKLGKPSRGLAAFQKTKTLQPGEREIEIYLTADYVCK